MDPVKVIEIKKSIFEDNEATGDSANGGAIYFASKSKTTLTDVTFNGNTAFNGTDHAFYCAGSSSTTVDGITFYLPCGTPQITTSSSSGVHITVHSDKVYDQSANPLDITAGYVVASGSATITYVQGV